MKMKKNIWHFTARTSFQELHYQFNMQMYKHSSDWSSWKEDLLYFIHCDIGNTMTPNDHIWENGHIMNYLITHNQKKEVFLWCYFPEQMCFKYYDWRYFNDSIHISYLTNQLLFMYLLSIVYTLDFSCHYYQNSSEAILVHCVPEQGWGWS